MLVKFRLLHSLLCVPCMSEESLHCRGHYYAHVECGGNASDATDKDVNLLCEAWLPCCSLQSVLHLCYMCKKGFQLCCHCCTCACKGDLICCCLGCAQNV